MTSWSVKSSSSMETRPTFSAIKTLPDSLSETPSKELNNHSPSNSDPVSSIRSLTEFKGPSKSSPNIRNQSSCPEALMSPLSTQPNSGASNQPKSRRATFCSKATSSAPFTKTVCSRTTRSWSHQSARVESPGWPPLVSTTSTKRFWNSNSTVSRPSTQ